MVKTTEKKWNTINSMFKFENQADAKENAHKVE